MFVDPRSHPTPPWPGRRRPRAATPGDVDPLVRALALGDLYEAEAWVAAGNPIQFDPPNDPRRTPLSPLRAAIENRHRDAVLLVLCNGYDPILEEICPFSVALDGRRRDIIDLLLAWGATPSSGCTEQLVSCYDAKVIEKLWRCGLDLNERKILASELASSTRNLPLYGFVKRHAREDPRLQRGLDVGLCRAVERRNQKAVSLCMWAGADPWAQVRYPWYREEEEDDLDADEGWSVYLCAAGHALFHRRPEFLRLMKVSGDAPHFQELYSLVHEVDVFDVLYRIAPPADLSAFTCSVLGMGSALLRRLFELGGRVQRIQDSAAKGLRDQLRRAGSSGGRELVSLLQDPAHVDESVFLKGIHSPKVIDNAKELGITLKSLEKLAALPTTSPSVRAAARRPLRKWRRREQRLAYEARKGVARAPSGDGSGSP